MRAGAPVVAAGEGAGGEGTRSEQIQARKGEHLELALGALGDAGAGAGGAGWEDVQLVHEALPEVDMAEIDLATELLDARLRAPLVIAGMTGGHPAAEEINARLGAAAQRHGLAVGVGSQRAATLERGLAATYEAVRRSAPDAYVIANIGAAQLVRQAGRPPLSVGQVEELVAMIGADALAVHLNFHEELIQPEGDRRSRGCGAAIASLCKSLRVPVIVKETGAGMSQATVARLADLGVAAVDVGGAGGTSFVEIERLRAQRQGDGRGAALGETFAGWGIPTAVAVSAAVRAHDTVIASGGVRSGLDAAKALALGARAVGVGRPLLAAAVAGEPALDAWVERFLHELRTAMFLTGATRPAQLAGLPLAIGGRVRGWLESLGCLPAR